MKMRNKKIILITRPAEEARLFARRLRAEGFNVAVEPMLEIEHLDFKLPNMSSYQGLVFTSVNAVRALAARLGDKVKGFEGPCYCVGDRTAKEARAQGFLQAISAKGTADELIDLVCGRVEDKSLPLLYVCGHHTARPVDKLLRAHGYKVDTIVVYKAQAVRKLTPQCLAAIKAGKIEAVTFFSKRTVDTFIRELKKNGLLKELLKMKLLSISDSMLESVRPYKKARTYTADTPDAPGMMRLLNTLYKRDDLS